MTVVTLNISFPRLKINKSNQLVKVFTANNELVNVIRISGTEHLFSVPDGSRYYIVVGDGEKVKKIANLPESKRNEIVLEVEI
jgi:hypothetical protein